MERSVSGKEVGLSHVSDHAKMSMLLSSMYSWIANGLLISLIEITDRAFK